MLFNFRRIRSVTHIPSGLPYIWQRYGKYALVYAGILLVLSFFPFWKIADLWLFSAVIENADHRAKPASVTLDLDAKRGDVRRKLTSALNAMPEDPKRWPKVTVIDVLLTPSHGPDGLPAALARINRSSRVLGAVDSVQQDASTAINSRDDALYADQRAFSGIGHTLLQVVSHLPTDRVVGYYPATWPIKFSWSAEPIAVPAIAMMINPDTNPDPEALDGTNYFWTSPRAQPITPGTTPAYAGKTLIIGNSRTQATDATYSKRSGMELLSWAIDEVRNTPDPFFDVPTMWLVTAIFSCVGVVTFVAIWRPLKTRTFSLPLTFVLASGLAIAALLACDEYLFMHHKIFTELTLVVIGIFTGATIAYVWCVETIRHERFLIDLGAKVKGEERYDVFISYARTPENLAWVQKNVVAPLQQAKHADGTPVRVFFDSESIATGTDFYDEVVKGIYSSRFFLPIYSTAYFNRYYCRDEIALALFRRKTVTNFIKPISRLRSLWVAPKNCRGMQYISVRKQPDFIDEILRWIAGKETA